MFSNPQKKKLVSKKRRQARVRVKIFGTAKKPRLNISRSLNHIYLQLIDDDKGKTLVSFHSKAIKVKGGKTEIARLAGERLAKGALTAKITACVFDRGSCLYHGRVKAAAEGARQAGLKF